MDIILHRILFALAFPCAGEFRAVVYSPLRNVLRRTRRIEVVLDFRRPSTPCGVSHAHGIDGRNFEPVR